jgi:multidrug resistance protein, MATE family
MPGGNQHTRPLLPTAADEQDRRRADDDDEASDDDGDLAHGSSFLSATLAFSDRPSSFASHFAPPPPVRRRASVEEQVGGVAARLRRSSAPDDGDDTAAAEDDDGGNDANDQDDGSVTSSWSREALALARLAVPLAVEGICNVSLPLVTLAFVGRIPAGGGDDEGGDGVGRVAGPRPNANDDDAPPCASPSSSSAALALSSAVMANSIFTVTGYSLICGLASALETLCGAAYGAGELPLCGVLWMRALLLCLSASALPAAAWLSGALGPLLIAWGQPPEVVRGCARYLKLLAPAVVAAAVAESTGNYLLAQGVARPGMAITLLTIALSVVYNRVLVLGVEVGGGFGGGGGGGRLLGGLGLDGAALAQVASFATLAALLTAYKAWRDGGRGRRGGGGAAGGGGDRNSDGGTPDDLDATTWPEGGWRTSVGGGPLAGWGPYLRVAYACVLLLWLEWAAWEMLVFLAGLLPADQSPQLAVGVAGLAVQLSLPPYMVSFATGTAVSTRVAQGLGAGNARAARRSAVVASSGIALVNGALAAALFSARRAVPAFFAAGSGRGGGEEGGGGDDDGVAAMTSKVVPAICLTMLFDGQVACLTGVLRGTGRQGLGAAAGLFCYWAVGLPLALLLGFKARMGVLGLWLAPACGTALQAALLSAYVWGGRLDWQREVRRARRRLVRSGGGRGGGGAL